MTDAAHGCELAQVLYARLAAQGRVRQLQLLVEIDDCGSIARAASQLHLSQPAATQALAELERVLGVKLFERHARGMRATAAGGVLIAAARSTLAGLREAAEQLAAISRGATAALRLGAIPAATVELVPALLAALAEAQPDVHVELKESSGAQLLPLLTSGALDAVFCRRPDSLHAGFVFEPLQPDAVVVVAGSAHPLARHRGLGLNDLADACWVLPPANTQLRDVFEQHVLRALPQARWLPVSTLSLYVLEGVLQRQSAVSLLPASLAPAICATGRVVTLDLPVAASIDALGVAYDAANAPALLQQCLQLARRQAQP